MARLTWYEAVRQDKQLTIRWPAEEKRLRTLIFVPAFSLVAGFVLAFLRLLVDTDVRHQVSLIGAMLTLALLLGGFCAIWFAPLWVLDKEQNAVLHRGWRKVARMDEFDRFIVKREKRGIDIVFVMLAERADGSALEFGVMNQDDAQALGYELARFTRRPYSSR